MSRQTLNLTPQVYDYLLSKSLREPAVLSALREATRPLSGANMQISPEQGQFLALLMKLLQAKKTLDIGTFTGYSALSVALALPDDGQVISCDISEKDTAMARTFWQQAGVAHKISLKLAPALETLDQLIAAGAAGSFDFVFIDADKYNYLAYYERALQLLRPGGLVAVDNVLWSGHVADHAHQDKQTLAIRALNDVLQQDQRIDLSMLPIGDGLSLALKK